MRPPSTSTLDSFTQADGALSGSWTGVIESGQGTPTVLTNRVVGGTGGVYNSAYWNAATYLQSEASITWPAAATNLGAIKCYCRISSPGAGLNAYWVHFSADNNQTYFYRSSAGSTTVMMTSSFKPAILDQLAATCYTDGGDIILEGWFKRGSAWELAGAYKDTGAVATYPALASAGNIGFSFYANVASNATYSVDDFGGGEFFDIDVAWFKA